MAPEMGIKAAASRYSVRQHTIIIDVLGGWSSEVNMAMTKSLGREEEKFCRKHIAEECDIQLSQHI